MKKHSNIQDPKQLRALAHPLRWKIIDLLTVEGQATATRCAEALGESVANCSYHLNTLAKYGYVEQAPGGQGREKPWRMASVEQTWDADGGDVSPEKAAAGQAASEAFLDYEATRMKAALRRGPSEPEPWRKANGFSATVAFVTPEELAELRTEMETLLKRYNDRFENTGLRPEGHRAVRLFFASSLADRNEEGSG
ncbi:helix-turn-helix domain-containing protein [Allokutzneria sp. A3M-2-11 16]|uniref:winged helix-turn-helix domain-containing protein n=1 Tax=Allokutzneria sp. A3M-2-11 16 TaxID=2962043 RepID=UPI0020B8BFFF|nr:helix-turn-helix domain-containing protein [Allokutzneria sp. A3M-2-11 16]MCP3802681.1 helix-turn-helix domain-containing protein [Allokutzneria sp. A3M-2-11 16]